MSNKKYIAFDSGFIRKGNWELNWSLYNWAILFEIQINETLIGITFLCVTIFKIRNNEDKKRKRSSL